VKASYILPFKDSGQTVIQSSHLLIYDGSNKNARSLGKKSFLPENSKEG
jgi:hypothetical protein